MAGLVYTGGQQTGVQGGDLYTLSGNTGTNAGSYTATASLKDTANYRWDDGTTAAKTIGWSIGKAQLIASYGGESIAYGGSPVLKVDVAGFVGGESAATAAGYKAPTVSASSTNAGSYRLVPAGGSATNYEFSYVGGVLTIERAVAVVAADSRSKVYGATDPTLTYSIIGAGSASEIGGVRLSRASGENVGDYAISVTAPGNTNYRVFTVGGTFTIEKAAYDMSGVRFTGATYSYSGAPFSCQVSGQLPSGLQVAYTGNGKTDAGTYTVVASFQGDSNHESVADMTATLTITKATVSVPGPRTGLVYNGSRQEGVNAGSTYDVHGGAGIDAGNYEAVVSLKNPDNYKWQDGTSTSKTVGWSIAKATYNMSGISFDGEGFVYDGDYHSIFVTGALPGGLTVAYQNNEQTEAGAYTVTAKFYGDANHEPVGDRTAVMTIDPAPLSSIVPATKSYVYNGQAKSPATTVKSGSTELTMGTDYVVAYSGNKNVGTATVTATGIGNYTGTVSANFTIKPAGTTIASVTPKSKALLVKWKKQSKQTSGYQVRCSLKKSMKGSKTVTVAGAKKTKATITNLTGGKTYYVQVRTYKTAGGTKYYSTWSAAVPTKTMK